MPGHRGKLAMQLKQLRQERNEARKATEKGEKAEKLAKEREAQLLIREVDLKAMLDARIAELDANKAELDAEKEGSRKMKAELARVYKSPGGPVAEGVIQWNVEVDAIGSKAIYSPYTDIGGLPFRIGAKSSIERSGRKSLISLCCNDSGLDKTFSAKAAFTLKLLSREGSSYSYKRGVTGKVFTPLDVGSELEFAWAAASQTIENGFFRIEAQIKLLWFYKDAFFDFFSPDPLLSDMILLVGGRDFHVNSKYLAHFSEVFKMMSLHTRQGGDPVPLMNIDADEFEEMLRMIYPQRWPTKVTDENVRYLLRLADFFDIPFIRTACSEFLKEKNSPVSTAIKFLLAEQYRLSDLHDWHLAKLGDEVERVVHSAEFARYSDGLKATLRQMWKQYPKNDFSVMDRNNDFAEFSSVDPLLLDVTLLAGGTEFRACKIFLAVVSGYFKTLFSSDSSLDRVELPPEVDASDFKEFLRLLHPGAEAHPDNVESQLWLADFFDAPIIRWRYIDYLEHCYSVPYGKMFLFSECFRLPELRDNLLRRDFDASRVLNSDYFNDLSIALQLDILKKGVNNAY